MRRAPRANDDVSRALDLLERTGLLLLQDARLPSLVGLVAGGPVRGSWWAHPSAHDVFRVATFLDDHPDVASSKLVSGKVTFVHRRLWAPLVAVGRAREPWQTTGLTASARALLAQVDAEGSVRATGKDGKLLEQRLLVAAREVHTESGAHATELCTWEAFAHARRLRLPRTAPARAKDELQAALSACDGSEGATLPWSSSVKRGRARR